MDQNNTSASQVRVRFSTRDQNLVLDEPGPILVPTTFRRYALSTLVNSLLQNEKAVPLEFIINGTYLRTNLEEYLSSNGISTETTLSLEYVKARIPPQYVASFEHDDWISSVDVLSASSGVLKHFPQTERPAEARILSSSYDGHIRVWNQSSQLIATSPNLNEGGYHAIVKASKFVSPTQIVSSGSDRVIRLWKYSEEQDGFQGSFSAHLGLYGHNASVDSISVNSKSNRLLSGSADHTVGLWSTRKTDAPAVSEDFLPQNTLKNGKRRKINNGKIIPQRGPLAILNQHTQPVSGADFDVRDATVAYSCSWDQSVRTWDLVTASLVDTRTTANALLCIEQMPELNLIAAGSAGRDIKLIDPRASATMVTSMTLKGHKNKVVSLARDPNNEYSIVSGSHDGTCRVWDVRSAQQGKDGVTGQSLYTLVRQSLQDAPTSAIGDGIKVFSVRWDAQVGIVSGGEDKMVQINHSEDT